MYEHMHRTYMTYDTYLCKLDMMINDTVKYKILQYTVIIRRFGVLYPDTQSQHPTPNRWGDKLVKELWQYQVQYDTGSSYCIIVYGRPNLSMLLHLHQKK